MQYRKLWIGLAAVVIVSFGVLGYYGFEIYREAPPVPERVVTDDGTLLFTAQNIKDGQNVWQSIGGQQVGSIWGHGAYVAPDWSADWLHREAEHMVNDWSNREYQKPFKDLDSERQAMLQARLANHLRENSYDPETKTLTVSADRAAAMAAVAAHYTSLFMDDPELATLRENYAIPDNTIRDPERMELMNNFFFWTSWASVTLRPGKTITYTNNWPPDELVGNTPSSWLLFWSLLSIILLIAGIGALASYYFSLREEGMDPSEMPDRDPLFGLEATPSMKATLKYFWIVTALILAQIGFGILTVHYSVEGQGLYGLPLADWLPYSITRTWHVQIAIFWIATSWLATGLFLAPAVSGHEPKFQRAGVNFLFIALLVIVVGSLLGQWLGVMQKLGLVPNFYFGHQGYEYVDLGRFWQAFLFVGLLIWLFLMTRALKPAFKEKGDSRHLLSIFLISAIAIALFYGAGLMWGRQTNLAIAEYWRWWVVHLWVEGFFEVFATVVIAFLFVRLGLLRAKMAVPAVLFATIVFLTGGIIGTFHHLYFTGTPTPVLALGATFSALEVVPLVLIGYEAFQNLQLARAKKWVQAYKWPIYMFIAVAFWNLVGAGVFGFLINPPIALYYMQGLNTTPVHGHTALFGVYGILGIGLMLFVLKGLDPQKVWKEPVIKFSFWALNIGLMLMVLISVLPVGLAQVVASVQHGLWYARSAEFLQQPYMITLRWMRMLGDVIFAAGAAGLAWFVVGLKTGWSIAGEADVEAVDNA